MTLAPSPVVALSRAIAIGQSDGPERGLSELRAIEGAELLERYPFYQAALGALSAAAGNADAARTHYDAALALARNPMERRFLQRKRDRAV